MNDAYLVSCPNTFCVDGYVDGELCPTCDGNAKLVLPAPRRSRWHRSVALIVMLSLIGIAAYALGGLVR